MPPMRSTRILLAALTALLVLPATAPAKPHDNDRAEPLVIGHRGASGYRPEHTLESYRLAAEQGADYIEPDLVTTKDGVLVARHEPEIGGTTNVADHPEFAARKTTKVIDGVAFTGWFTEDFTLAELKTLRAKERIPQIRPANTAYDGKFEVPTFQEVLDLRARLSRKLHRAIGVYPETKHPTYFRSIGLPLEPGLVRTLERNGLNRRGAPVFVQSFETGNLRALDPAEGAARAAARRADGRDAGRRHARTYARARDAGGPARASRATPTASGRRRTTSSRATPIGRSRRRRRSSTTRTRRPAGPPVHVPAREPVPAARAARRRPTPTGDRRPEGGDPAVLRARRRRRVHRQPRHRGRRAPVRAGSFTSRSHGAHRLVRSAT